MENYIHLKDSIQSEIPTNSIGKLIVLPATFTGSPRYLQQYTQDAMTYVRHGGKPTLFITYTCNPKNEELLSHLNGQTANLRQDTIARVFHQQILIFHDILVKGKTLDKSKTKKFAKKSKNFLGQLFGDVKYYLYAVEWQKRGLPHIHILLWFSELINPNEIDNIICAELPDIQLDKELYELVLRHMIHGPCGKHNEDCPCMKDTRCTKSFPKEFITNTQIGHNGYPCYRRRNKSCGGNTAIINMKKKHNWLPFEVDNRFIIII